MKWVSEASFTDRSGNIPKKTQAKRIGFFLILFFCALLCTAALTLRLAGIQVCIVQGHSMDNTLFDGERLFINPSAKPRFGDIAVFQYGESYVIKRVIGLPGDTVSCVDGTLCVNDVAYEEGYLTPALCEEFETSSFLASVGEGEYFVLGDNRDNSRDSRVFGCLPEEAFVGVAIFKI